MKTLGDFLARFVAPLIGAGEVHIAAPVRLARVAEWALELARHSAELEAIDQLRQRAAATLVVQRPSLLFGELELRIMVGVHNLLYLSHPEADGTMTTRAQRARVGLACLNLLRAPAATSQATLLARHTLIEPVFELERRDIDLKWWTGSRRFHGQKVPGRLKLWPRLRNVTETVRRVPFWEVFSEDAAAAVGELFALSPLTDLLWPARGALPFSFEHRHLAVLADRELGRLLCYHLGRDLAAHAHTLGGALGRTLGQSSVPARPFVELLLYLHYLHAQAASPLQLQPLGPGTAAHAGLFWALPAAAAKAVGRIVGPPGWDDEPAGPSATAWRAYLAQAGAAAGLDVVESLAPRLAAVLSPPLATPTPLARTA